jgi:hypothetical protein
VAYTWSDAEAEFERMDAAMAPLRARLADYLGTTEGSGWSRLFALLKEAREDHAIKESKGAREFLDLIIELVGDAPRDASEPFQRIDDWGAFPNSALGLKFRQGRRVNATSRLRRAIAAHLKKNPRASARAVWDALKGRPPRGVEFHEPSGSLDGYIRTPGASDTGYRRFCNLCSEERRKLTG